MEGKFNIVVLDDDGVVERFETVEEARAEFPHYRIEVETDEQYAEVEDFFARAFA